MTSPDAPRPRPPRPPARPRPGPDPGWTPTDDLDAPSPDAPSVTTAGPSTGPPTGPPTGPSSAPRASRAERRRHERRGRRRVVVLAIAALAVVVGVVLVIIRIAGGDDTPSARAHSTGRSGTVDSSGQSAAFADPSSVGAALAAARIGVVTVDSYDYRTLAHDRAAGVAVTTGAFRTAYSSSMSGAVTTHAARYRTVQACSVQSTGLASLNATATQADVLVYASLAITGTDTRASATPTPVSLNVTMQLVGGNWLIAAMSDLGQQAGTQAPPPGTDALVAAVDAGRQAVLNLISYRRAHFDDDFSRALDGLSSTAAGQQAKSKASILASMNAGSFDLGGSIVEVAVEDAGFDSATLLVSGHRYEQADDGTQKALPDLRAEASMTRVGGKWLLSQFSPVGTG